MPLMKLKAKAQIPKKSIYFEGTVCTDTSQNSEQVHTEPKSGTVQGKHEATGKRYLPI